MSLDELKKEFMQIAIRYDSKSFMYASCKRLTYDGVGNLFNGGDGKARISVGFYEHVQAINNYTGKFLRNYELKGFLIKLRDYIKSKDYTSIEFNVIHGKLYLEAYEEVKVNLGEDEE